MLMEAIGVGERLRKAREARGLSLDAVAASTHIRERYLEALEEERFEEIPGPAYVKGFLRNYAAHLGLPEEEIMGDVAAIHPELKRVSVAIPDRWEERPRRAAPVAPALRVIGWAVLVVAIGGAYVAYTRYGHLRAVVKSAPSSPGATVTVQATPPNPPPVITTAPPLPSPVQTPSAPNAEPGHPAADIPRPGTTSPPPPSSGAPALPAQIQASPTAATPAKPVRPPHPSSPPRAPLSSPSAPAQAADSVTVEVVAADRAWLRVVADGHTVYDGALVAGERRSWEGRHQVILSTTNAGALEVAANGRPIGRLGRPDQVMERSFAPSPAASP
jgi:cytoskeleton protein RodZ